MSFSVTRLFPAATVLAALVLLAACGDDDDAAPSPAGSLTPLPSLTPSTTAATSPTAAPTVDPTRAQNLAKSPAFVLYEARAGDTVESVARALGAGARDIAELNGITGSNLAQQQLVAVPLNPDPGQLFPVDALAAALGLDAAGATLKLYAPSSTLVDGYLGRLALARVRYAGPESVDGAGYVLDFYFTDRPPLKGGQPDGEASYTDPAFTLGGGSLAPDLLKVRGAAFGAFQADGVAYAMVTYAETGREPAQVWESLEPVAP